MEPMPVWSEQVKSCWSLEYCDSAGDAISFAIATAIGIAIEKVDAISIESDSDPDSDCDGYPL